MIDVLIPVLGRPQAIAPLADSIVTTSFVPVAIVFLCSPDDEEATEECVRLAHAFHQIRVRSVAWPAGAGDWAKKINLGYLETRAPFLLLGATDLRFHRGWDAEALRVAEAENAGVIGTNDLGNPTVMRGAHSTHPLVRRSYIDEQGTIDEPGKILHEGYEHQWVDTELVATAKARGRWAFADGSHVEHLHPIWGKGVMDETYEKALASTSARRDQRLYARRSRLWKARPVRRSLSSARRSGRASAS